MNQTSNISLENILENTSFGIIQVDLEGKIVYANASAFKILEINTKDFIGVHFFNVSLEKVNEDFIPLSKEDQPLYHVLKEQKTITNFVQGTVIKDKIKWFSISASPIYNNEGEFTGGLSSFADITEQINIQLQYKENAERNRLLVENVQAVFWEAEIGSLALSYVSPKAKEIFGYSLASWMQEGFWESIIFHEDRQRIISLERGGQIASKSYQLEYRMVKSDGTIIWVKDLVEVVMDSAKPRSRGLLVDISDQKEVESRLKASEEKYMELIKEAPYAITIYNKKGTLIAANEKCDEIWQLDQKKYIGTYNLFQDQEFADQGFGEPLKEAFSGRRNEFSSEVILPMTGGVKKNLHIKYYPLYDSEGQVENVIFVAEDVTAYKKAEEKARTGESLKQGILDALDEGILVVDQNGIIINVNRSFTLYVKNQIYPKPEIGKSVFDFFEYFEERSVIKDGLENILNKATTLFDHELRLSDRKWYNLRITQLKSPFGAVILWQNINTRKEIEMALERSLKKYRNIYNKAPVMMHSVDQNVEIVSVSDFWLAKMGYDRNEVIGKRPSSFMTELSQIKEKKFTKEFFEKGSISSVEYQFIKKNGERIYVLLSATAEYDENGEFERSISGMIDVTELKVAEGELKESQINLLESQRLSKIGNYEFFMKQKVFESSSEMDVMMGLDTSDRNLSILDRLIHPSDLSGFLNKLEVSMKTGKDFFHVYRISHLKSEKLKWISGRGRMVKDQKGDVIKMIGTVQDITEQKSIEEKVRRLTDRILLATEIAGIGVWEFDREKEEIFWEEQMYTIFDDRKKPISNYTEMASMLHEKDKYVVDDIIKKVKEGVNFIEIECRVHVRAELKYLRSFTRILRDQNGELSGMIGVFYDITHDKKLQLELETSLDEKNVLIKEVHHRVKNNMQLVSSILALKSYELKDEGSKEIFTEVNDRIKAMSIIHDKLYTFYNVSEINISEYINSIAGELRILLGSEQISINVSADEIIFDVDRALTIGLIISELVSNAFKHGFKNINSGTIDISIFKKGDNYSLAVHNDGEKIPVNVLKSTSGLGMSLIQTFVRQLLGTISLDSRNGFRVDF